MQSTPNTANPPLDERAQPDHQNKRRRGASNNDNQSNLSKAFRERSDAIKSAASGMSSALTSDDATKLLSEDEVARRWLIGIPENKSALLYLEQMIGRKHDE
ncbi:unnamed protein product [Arabis nemorensis]|uniref:Uncharacterized protein n=1 Tax=Arabis nemorensis TaxID=586526 RepID=A0A565AWE6_9BRAS|nr:unnamed protein product [Arabis nemorensis]